MSWSTYFTTTIEFPRKTYDYLGQVECDIEREQLYIKSARNTLRNLAIMTEPQKYCDEEDNPMTWVSHEVDDALEALEASVCRLHDLYLLKSGWSSIERKDGVFVAPADEKNYLFGDFIPNANDTEA